MGKFVVILDAKVEFNMGECFDMRDALNKFADRFPQLEKRNKYITVREIKIDQEEVTTVDE